MATYNKILRKLIVGFGDLFNNITLVRYNPDMSEAERMLVPIVYAPKEDYVMRLEEDPDLDKKVQMTLPRMSYQMINMTYDASRKLNTNFKSFSKTPSGVISQHSPVPYNFDFQLYLYVRHIEDGNQIIEHVLPFFTPDYTIKLNLIPEMGEVREVPIILNSVDMPVDFEGTRDRDTRVIVWTLDFTVKGYLFGPTTDTGLITHSITNVMNKITEQDEVIFNMNDGVGEYQVGEIVYQGYSMHTASASARVVAWSNNKLTLKEINGNFISTKHVVGMNTNASYLFSSYIAPHKFVQIDVTTDPPTANVGDNYTYVTSIQEFNN